MNSNEYNYGIDPISGLPRKLVRDTAVIQEELDSRTNPKAVIHLRIETYNPTTGATVTNETAGYEVVKGKISYNVKGEALPKHIIEPDGTITTPIDPETGEPYPRNNGYENIIQLSEMAIPFDTVLDNGIKEYYGIE